MSETIDGLIHFIVLYREPDMRLRDVPLGFECWAEDTDHAREQCLNANPGSLVLWFGPAEFGLDGALEDYWNDADRD